MRRREDAMSLRLRTCGNQETCNRSQDHLGLGSRMELAVRRVTRDGLQYQTKALGAPHGAAWYRDLWILRAPWLRMSVLETNSEEEGQRAEVGIRLGMSHCGWLFCLGTEQPPLARSYAAGFLRVRPKPMSPDASNHSAAGTGTGNTPVNCTSSNCVLPE